MNLEQDPQADSTIQAQRAAAENARTNDAASGSQQLHDALAPMFSLGGPGSATGDTSGIRRILFNDAGSLRVPWVFGIFLVVFFATTTLFSVVFALLHLISQSAGFSPKQVFWSELMQVIALVAAGAVASVAERRRSLLDYNLRDARGAWKFVVGYLYGFIALSLLVFFMADGHWLTIGRPALTGSAIYSNGALWAAAFLLVGCMEEGLIRCFLLNVMARAISLKGALIGMAIMCGILVIAQLNHAGSGQVGVYAFALLGAGPLVWLWQRHHVDARFWTAAWMSSTIFGVMHTGNHGENALGIFAAALIGFVFCASVKLTGSAWWAIGCHAAWDWAETYFYGVPDSGNIAVGHYLSAITPKGDAMMTGGPVGPEGSLLVVPVILLLWAAVYFANRKTTTVAA